MELIFQAEHPTPKSLEERSIRVRVLGGAQKLLVPRITVGFPIVMPTTGTELERTQVNYYRDSHSNDRHRQFLGTVAHSHADEPFFKAFRSWKLSLKYIFNVDVLPLWLIL